MKKAQYRPLKFTLNVICLVNEVKNAIINKYIHFKKHLLELMKYTRMFLKEYAVYRCRIFANINFCRIYRFLKDLYGRIKIFDCLLLNINDPGFLSLFSRIFGLFIWVILVLNYLFFIIKNILLCTSVMANLNNWYFWFTFYIRDELWMKVMGIRVMNVILKMSHDGRFVNYN